ncbi:TonB-dependent receptor plug domain-containing protein [Kluyvera ascorbata]|uniref:TonB-dependent receptor plug domain-containing protein n=1 Tax=Kluyvera ascorbata TaxID=51288 RepID=UPI0004E2C6DE|nr:TonB-dependent receptor [Kluyvera ascorbata]EJG2385907.1 TonB-dependent receptor [Kluyvera ascorbata]KFD02224.1 putative outer membrane receptor [Kluyvera ascorbata ATCC 33433]MDU1197791.1 TonB-dependent receptor [Kluyvera ascorbata]STW97748.1 Colicin I receptor precursor [Kluyvera ascorbata]BCA38523.1 ligand-gated channel [Kluyvera ascorbata]
MLHSITRGSFALSALSLFVASAASASTSSTTPNKTNKEETLVVTANRSESSLWESPATIQVIDHQTLQNSTSTSIADDLQDIPGVEITDNALAGRKQIRIRGEASSRVLILIDGQEVTYQRAGQNYGAGLLIDESALERIEVVKGPYSVLYGSQAIGGVVNFITKKGGDKPLSGTVKAVYNSATAGWEESAAAWGSIGQFDYRINGSYSDQGERDTPDGRLPNTNFRNNSQGVWLGYNLDNQHFGLSLDRYKLSTQTYYEDPNGDYDAFSVKLPKLEREKVGLFYDVDVDGDYLKKIHLDAYEQTIARKFENEVLTSAVHNQTQTNDKQYTQGVTLQSNISLPANNNLVVGTQYQRDRVSQTTNGSTYLKPISRETQTRAYNESEQSNTSLFAQNDWHFADNWTWTLGARQYWLSSKLTRGDSNSTTNGITKDTSIGAQSTSDNALVSATSLRYSGFDNIELRAAFAQGYVFPTLTQLFSQTSAGGGTTYGNANLKAEHSNNYELGARYNGNLWLVDGAVYYSQAKDYIASVACSGQAICNGTTNSARSGNYYYDNIDRAKTWGMELSAEYNGWVVSPYVSGNLIRREYESPTGKTTNTGEPTINGRAGVKHTLMLNAANVTSDLFIRAASSAKDDTGTEETRTPGWATLNLAVNTEFGANDQYQVNLALNNLTDKRYRTAHESIPAAGLNAAVGFAWKF